MKKPISILLAVAAVCASLSFGTVSADAVTIKGDVNGDNSITLRDATIAQKINAGSIAPTSNQQNSADFNSNGTVDLTDALMIQKYVCLDRETLKEYSPNRSERINFLEALNKERTSKGLDPIAYNDAMLEAGNIRAREYQQNKDHIRPSGKSYTSILSECNLRVNANVDILEKYADDTSKGAKLFKTFKETNGNSPVFQAMMSAECTTVCVGCIPDSSMSDRGYWIIITN